MDQKERVKAFSELFELLTYYYENRDQPVDSDFDFFKEIKILCEKLEMDYDLFKEEFHLSTLAK